jgi:hypothetical protein
MKRALPALALAAFAPARLEAADFNDVHFHLTNVVAPRDPARYFGVYDMYAPLWKLLTPEASEKVRLKNYERIFDAARPKVRAWEKAQSGRG